MTFEVQAQQISGLMARIAALEARLQQLILVQGDGAIDVEPVTLLADTQVHLGRRHLVDPQLAALRPFDHNRAGIGLQLQQQIEAALQVLDDQLLQVGAPRSRKVGPASIRAVRSASSRARWRRARCCLPSTVASTGRPPSPAT